MLFPIKDREDLEKLNEFASVQDQVKAVRLQDKLGKQNFYEDMKKLFEPVTKTIKDVSPDVTKTMMITAKENNQALENLNNKLLEMMKDRGLLASYMMTPLSKITHLENTTQFKLVKDSNSNRVNDLKRNKTVPSTLHDNLLTFRDTNKVFDLQGDLLKMITNKNYNVDLASLQDKKLMYDFAKEMNLDMKSQGNKSTRHKTLIELLKSTAIMASVVSKTLFLSSDPNELCDRLKLLLQGKHAGNISNIINEEIIAIVDKIFAYKCLSKKQPKQILIKCNLLHE